MEAMEEEVAPQPSSPPTQPSNNGAQDLCLIAKGKRTKRYRPHSPIPLVIAPLTIVTEHINNKIDQSDNIPSPAIASSEESTTTEDIETAQCLMLLAQGRFSSNLPPNHNNNNNNSNKRQIQGTGGSTACVYTCKTCDRSFSSFQALGGHRASHKKPKNEKKRSMFFSDEEDFPSPLRTSSNSLSLQLSNISSTTFSLTPKSSPSPRFHVCSYCGMDFTSGQALGGHMRKHRSMILINSSNNRSSNVVTTRHVPVEERCDESERMRNALSLDLNLPAPEDEVHQRFGFVARKEDESRSDHEINDDTTKTALALATITPDHTTTTPIVALLN